MAVHGRRLLTDHELQFHGLQSVGKLTSGMATMLYNLAVDSMKHPTSQLNVLFTALLSEKNDDLNARVDLLSSIVKLALFWDAETTPSQLHEPQIDVYNIRLWGDAEILLPSTAGYVSTSAEDELTDYWKRYLDGTLPFFRALRLAEKSFFHLGRTEWLAREIEILSRLNQKQTQAMATRQDPLAGLKSVAISSLSKPVSLQNTTLKEYVLARVSLKPVIISNHLQIVGNIAETFWKKYANGDRDFWRNVTYQTEETLTATTSAFKSVNSSIGKGESFKIRMQDYVKRMLLHPEHALKSQTGYIVPIVLGDSSYQSPEIDANHLLSVNEILEACESISNNGTMRPELTDRLEFFLSLPQTHSWRTERRVLHPVAYTYLLYETTHIEQTAFPILARNHTLNTGEVQREFFSPERWDVFTGRPIVSYEDGFYQTHFLRHGAPVTLCVSYETCRKAAEEIKRRERQRRRHIAAFLDTHQSNNNLLNADWASSGDLLKTSNNLTKIPQQVGTAVATGAVVFGAENFSAPSVDLSAGSRDSAPWSTSIYTTIGDKTDPTLSKVDFCNLTELASFIHCCLHRPTQLQTPEEHAIEMDLGLNDDDMMVADDDFDVPAIEEKVRSPLPPKATLPAPKPVPPKVPTSAAKQQSAPKLPAKVTSKPNTVASAPKAAPPVKKPTAPAPPHPPPAKKAAAVVAVSNNDEDDDIQVVSVVSKPAPAKKPPPAAPKKKTSPPAAAAVASGDGGSLLEDLQKKMAMMNEMYQMMQQTMALMTGAGAANSQTPKSGATAKKSSSAAAAKPKSTVKQLVKQQKANKKKAAVDSDEELCEVDKDAEESDDEPVEDDAKAEVDDVERMFLEEADGLGDEDSDKEDRFEKKTQAGFRLSSNADFLYLTPKLDQLSEKRSKADQDVINDLEASGVVWYRPWPESSYLTCLNSSPAAAILCSILIGTDSKNRDLRAPAFADSTINLLAAIAEQSPTHFVQVLAKRDPKDPRYKVFTAISTFMRNLLILQDDVQKWSKVHSDVPFREARPKDNLEALFTLGKDIDMKDGRILETRQLIDVLVKDDIDWNEQILKFLAAAEAMIDPSLSLLENAANLADNLDIKQNLYTVFGDSVLRALAYMFCSTKDEELVEITANPRYRKLQFIEIETLSKFDMEVAEVTGKRKRGGNASQARLAELVKKYCKNSDDENSDVYEAPNEEEDEEDDDSGEYEGVAETEQETGNVPQDGDDEDQDDDDDDDDDDGDDGQDHEIQVEKDSAERVDDADLMDVVVYDEENNNDDEDAAADADVDVVPPSKKRGREEIAAAVDVDADEEVETPDAGVVVEEPAPKRAKLELTYESDGDDGDLQAAEEPEAEQEESKQEEDEQQEEPQDAELEQVEQDAPNENEEEGELVQDDVGAAADADENEEQDQLVEDGSAEDEKAESEVANPDSQHVLGESESEITTVHDFMPPIRSASTRVVTSMDQTEEFMDDVMDDVMADVAEPAAEPVAEENQVTNDDNPVTDDNQVTDDYNQEEEQEEQGDEAAAEEQEEEQGDEAVAEEQEEEELAEADAEQEELPQPAADPEENDEANQE